MEVSFFEFIFECILLVVCFMKRCPYQCGIYPSSSVCVCVRMCVEAVRGCTDVDGGMGLHTMTLVRHGDDDDDVARRRWGLGM